MPWITIIWSMIAAASLTLALVHFIVWLRRYDRWAHLSFAFVALSVAGFTLCDLAFETARTPAEYGYAMWLVEFAVMAYFVAVVLFVRIYLKADTLWLGLLIISLRGVFLALNLPTDYGINYTVIDRIDHVIVLGESLARPVGIVSPWRHFGEMSEFGLIVFLLIATITVWRRGERRKAILTSGSNAAFMMLGAGQAALVFHEVMPPPLLVVPSFLFVITAMSFELSSEVLRAADLTETVQAREAELRESEERMDLASRAADLGHWVWDIQKDEIWATAKGRSLYGIGLTERVTLTRFLQTLHPGDRDTVQAGIKAAIESLDDFNSEYRVVLSGGVSCWIAVRGRIEANAAGEPMRMLGVSLDITHRRMAEERAQQIVEASSNAMIVVDTAGTIQSVNSRAEQMFCLPRFEMCGQAFSILVPERQHPSQADGFEGWLHGQATWDGKRDSDIHGLRRDGTEFPIEVGVNPFHTPEGTFMLVSIIDITDRKLAELESARQRNELAHMSRVNMLGELSGSMAHELNQPLASILSNAQAAQRFLARDDADLAEVRDILNEIVVEDKRAGEVIRRLRLLLKKGEVHLQPLEINEVVLDVLRLVRSDLINHSVEAATDLWPALPLVDGDSVQLQQILLNLVKNACDAMLEIPSAQRLILISTRPFQGSGIEIQVTDQGIGIPTERLETIFEPFMTTKSTGMGLGLSVCRTIATAHGGKLWASNHAAGGATFHLTLPAGKGVP